MVVSHRPSCNARDDCKKQCFPVFSAIVFFAFNIGSFVVFCIYLFNVLDEEECFAESGSESKDIAKKWRVWLWFGVSTYGLNILLFMGCGTHCCITNRRNCDENIFVFGILIWSLTMFLLAVTIPIALAGTILRFYAPGRECANGKLASAGSFMLVWLVITYCIIPSGFYCSYWFHKNINTWIDDD